MLRNLRQMLDTFSKMAVAENLCHPMQFCGWAGLCETMSGYGDVGRTTCQLCFSYGSQLAETCIHPGLLRGQVVWTAKEHKLKEMKLRWVKEKCSTHMLVSPLQDEAAWNLF